MADTRPMFVTPKPTVFEGHSIIVDDGYRPGIEPSHKCDADNIFYYALPVDLNQLGPRPHTLHKQVTGWWCHEHGPLGEDGSLDRYYLWDKCSAWLFDLAMADKIDTPSNGSHGDSIAHHVMGECVGAQRFDDGFIEVAVRAACPPVTL